MNNYNKIIELANELIIGNDKLEAKHVKAESARQRNRINEIKKLATEAKKELIAKDATIPKKVK